MKKGFRRRVCVRGLTIRFIDDLGSFGTMQFTDFKSIHDIFIPKFNRCDSEIKYLDTERRRCSFPDSLYFLQDNQV